VPSTWAPGSRKSQVVSAVDLRSPFLPHNAAFYLVVPTFVVQLVCVLLLALFQPPMQRDARRRDCNSVVGFVLRRSLSLGTMPSKRESNPMLKLLQATVRAVTVSKTLF
jgi:hypothetical protein